jgi:hypothetical protein
MKNVGYIYVDDGYPESADYDSNYICYDRDALDGYKDARAEAGAQLRLERVKSSEVPAPATSALRFAERETESWARIGQSFARVLKRISTTLLKWRPANRRSGIGTQGLSNNAHEEPTTQAGCSPSGRAPAFSW